MPSASLSKQLGRSITVRTRQLTSAHHHAALNAHHYFVQLKALPLRSLCHIMTQRAGPLRQVLLLVCLWLLAVSAAGKPAQYHADYAVYHNYSSFLTHLGALAADPQLSPYLSLYHHTTPTHLNSTLYLVQLSSPVTPTTSFFAPPSSSSASSAEASNDQKLRLLFSFGEHPRELITIESFFDLLHNLTSPFTPNLPPPRPPRPTCLSYSSQLSSFVLSYLTLHFLPLLNPDGKRLMEQTGDDCQRHNGRRVDLNRNSAWEFGGEGSSVAVGHEEYRGSGAWSEVETQFFRDVVLPSSSSPSSPPSSSSPYVAYVSLHSGERQFFTPYVDTRSRQTQRLPPLSPAAAADVNAVGERIMAATHGHFRDWGVGWQRNSYSADGTLYDWVSGSAGVKYTLCVEMWGEPVADGQPVPGCFVQFNPRASELPAQLERVRPLYISLMLGVIEREKGVKFEYVDYERMVGVEERRRLERLCELDRETRRLQHIAAVLSAG